MKFIFNRDQFKINEQLFDSDNMQVEFGDTLIGGTLHRLLGIGRSALSKAQIQKYINRLDSKLASMVVQPTLDEINDERKEGEEITIEDLSEEGKKAEVAKMLLLAAENATKDDKESQQKAIELIASIPEDTVKELPAAASEALVKMKQDLQIEEEPKEETGLVKSPYTEGDIIMYNGKQVKVTNIDSEGITLTDEKGNEEKVAIDEIQKKDQEKIDKLINNLQSTINNANYNVGDNESVDKLIQTINDKINELQDKVNNSEWDEGTYNETKSAIGVTLIKVIQKFVDGQDVNESLDILLEKEEKVFTEKDFKKLKKDLEKESQKWKFTMQDLEQLNKKVAETKGIGEITGQQAKDIMNILTSAKDSMLHTKLHDEIRDKQKRYFDKLPSGRAINRKAYLNWTKGVNNILSYYKDFIPKKVLKLVSDSLDKDAISNDYVKLNKEFLDINTKSSSSTTKKEEVIKKSKDTASGFVGINKLEELKSRFTLIMNIDSGGSKETITFVNIAKKDSDLFFKFTIGANLKWLENYYKGKDVKGKVDPSTDMPYDTNNDMQDLKLSTNAKYGDVFFGKAKNVDTIRKGGKLNVIYFNLSDLVKNKMSEVGDEIQFDLSDVETKESSWTINTLGVLIGDKDFGYLEPTSGSDVKDVDVNITNQIASELANVLKKDVSDLKVGDTIVYQKKTGDKETNEAEILEFITDTFIRVKTTNSDDVKINADQIIL